MKVVVDTNILFSGMLNPHGAMSDLLLNSDDVFSFYSPQFILEELGSHRDKLLRLSGLSADDFEILLRIMLKKIVLISTESIPDDAWSQAAKLTADVDEFDTPFVALAIALDAKLWTGDKKLVRGLKSKGVNWVLDTQRIKATRSRK